MTSLVLELIGFLGQLILAGLCIWDGFHYPEPFRMIFFVLAVLLLAIPIGEERDGH